jgi:putative MATE family efflux protein
MRNLTKGSPVKVILMFAVPLFIGQLFQLFYSLVDTRIVGAFLGDNALAAVGATTSLCDLLNNLLNGFTNGFGIIIATYFGAGNKRIMKNAIAGTVVLSVSITLIISIIGSFALNAILGLLNVSPELFDQSAAYLRVIMAGLIAGAMYNMLASILRSIGDSFTPLIFLVISTVLNVVLDYTFIKYLNAGVTGAAVATVVSQLISAVLCFIYMYVKYPELHLALSDFAGSTPLFKRMLTTGASMSFMVSFVHIGTVALQTSINTFGTNIIVAHTAARKATNIFMLPFSVFGTTLATYCSQNFGAGEYSRIKMGIKSAVLMTFVWCTAVIVVANTLSLVIIRAITATSEPEVISTATLYLRINTALYYVPAVICLFRQAMQGFGDNVTPLISSSMELIVKVLAATFLAPAIGYMGIIVAEPIAWVVMVVPLVVSMRRFFRKYQL